MKGVSKWFQLTDSTNSGSLADASHRFIRMKTFGFDNRFDTVWKNDFSCKRNKWKMIIFELCIEMKDDLPPMSLLTRHSTPTQIHQHLSNGCRSNRRDWVTHQHQANPQTPHHHAIGYNVRAAKRYGSWNFRIIRLGKEHLPTVAHSTNWKSKRNKSDVNFWVEIM